MKAAILLTALAFGAAAQAAVLTWPGAAPCDGTLQSCVFTAGPGDVVRIAANDVEESISVINKSLTLEAAAGYLPRFVEDHEIIVNFTDGGNHTTNIRGLRFARGQINVFHDDGDGSIVIERNRFDSGPDGEPAIWISSHSDVAGADLDYAVRYNTISDSPPQSHGTIRVNGWSPASGWIRGKIEGNTIRVRGPNGKGIAVYDYEGSAHSTRIYGNTVVGAVGRGIDIYNGAAGGSIWAYVYSNLVHNPPAESQKGDGIALWSFGEPVTGYITNNTVINKGYALALRVGDGGSTTANVANNLIAHNFSAWLVAEEATLDERHNLFFDNVSEPDSIDATSIMADPLLHPNLPGRLRAGSPAIDAGDNVATGGFPALDARGNSRYISGSVDIGAFEFGDQWLLVRDPAGGNNNFAIDNPSLNDQPGLYPQITQVWNPYGRGGIYNDANEGLYYGSGFWRVFNESIGDDIPQGAAFAIFVPGDSLQATAHFNNTSQSTTQIDKGITNDHPKRLLAVSQHWNLDDAPGTYNDHPIGVLYAAGHWRIANLDIENIPAGADFTLFAQDPSQNAFEHIARGANISNNWTWLRHPLLDGNPCARMQVTQSADQGVFNAHPIGIWYDGSRWAIFNQDQLPMPENAAFHVIIDGDSQGCGLFSDRFEGL
ncbi:DUF7452 domain-containing protein [Wenzhouxiangella sp. EGI_FJ10305]|uniref:DUF7452 domain-containing protein n=1 Tax=Wenzhouxiangella sp. EGI_FJ10305 TaxID=3243768 RepID=UPI0035DB14C5